MLLSIAPADDIVVLGGGPPAPSSGPGHAASPAAAGAAGNGLMTTLLAALLVPAGTALCAAVVVAAIVQRRSRRRERTRNMEQQSVGQAIIARRRGRPTWRSGDGQRVASPAGGNVASPATLGEWPRLDISTTAEGSGSATAAPASQLGLGDAFSEFAGTDSQRDSSAVQALGPGETGFGSQAGGGASLQLEPAAPSSSAWSEFGNNTALGALRSSLAGAVAGVTAALRSSGAGQAYRVDGDTEPHDAGDPALRTALARRAARLAQRRPPSLPGAAAEAAAPPPTQRYTVLSAASAAAALINGGRTAGAPRQPR
jgi:hypothetical protein